MKDLVTLWFDKDGVLAKYDYSLYEGEYGAPAPWLVHNAHVFRNLEPYSDMCFAVRQLYDENFNKRASDRSCNVRILTAVSDGVTLAEHVIDGADWCRNFVGVLPKDFYACAVSKESVPVTLRSKISPTDVLLDDFKPNLAKWTAAGGTAIKVVNGINSVTDKYPYICTEWDSSTIYEIFKYIISVVSSGEKLSNGCLLPFK